MSYEKWPQLRFKKKKKQLHFNTCEATFFAVELEIDNSRFKPVCVDYSYENVVALIHLLNLCVLSLEN